MDVQSRNEVISIALNSRERERLQLAVRAKETTVSEFARPVIMAAVDRYLADFVEAFGPQGSR